MNEPSEKVTELEVLLEIYKQLKALRHTITAIAIFFIVAGVLVAASAGS